MFQIKSEHAFLKHLVVEGRGFLQEMTNSHPETKVGPGCEGKITRQRPYQPSRFPILFLPD